MIEKTLARRYATAMLSVALREQIVEDVESSLIALKAAYVGDEMFRRVLTQPRIPMALRRRVLRKPFEGRANPAFLQFLDLLVDKHRTDLIPDIADSFDQLADASHGVVRVRVTSAFAISDAQRAALTEKLGRITGKKVVLQESLDRSLKGGMAVRIGDTVIDGSVLGRLKRLREYLYQLQRA